MFKGAVEAATTDLDTLDKWAGEYPGCAWRVILEGSGIWALDLDIPGPTHTANGVAALKTLIEEYGPLPQRPTSRSGSGGLALFWKWQGEPILGKSGTPVAGIDPLRGRQSVAVPPSIHPVTKLGYKWIMAPWEVTPPPAPSWLLALVRPPPRRTIPRGRTGPLSERALARVMASIKRIQSAREGSRNDTLNREAFILGGMVAAGLIGRDDAYGEAYHAAKGIGLADPEIRATLRSALGAGARVPGRAETQRV